jgi:hypothetical protein
MRTSLMASVTCLLVVFGSSWASAQGRIDIGALGGWTKPSAAGSVMQFNYGTTYELSVARGIWASDRVDLAIEVPFLATNSLSVKTPGASLPREYAVLSITPGIRVMFAPKRLVSVFGTVGGGFASYDESSLRADGSPNPGAQSNSTGAVSFGGGVDVRTGSWLGLRGEVRGVIAGPRHFSIPTPDERVQNLVITLGFVVRV